MKGENSIRRRLTEFWPGPVLFFLIFAVNILIAHRLFLLEYSDRLGSIEGTFIAIARQIVAHPRDLLWWPLWDCGLPFRNTYLPLVPFSTAALSGLTGHSAALSYHQVTAALYCLGPAALFLMAWRITGEAAAAFLAALAYSVISPSALLMPGVALDLGSPWRLRRLNILVEYGEGPTTAAMALLPIAILFMWLAIAKPRLWTQVLAGFFMGLTVLSNAFGGTTLAIAAVALLASVETHRFWRNLAQVSLTAVLAWAWISPLFPPSVLAAIRLNSPTLEGDYRFTTRSLEGWIVLVVGFAAVWLILRALRLRPHMRFFCLFAFLLSCIVLLGYFARMYVVPQPHRYQNVMDLAICLVAAFAIVEALRRLPWRVSVIAGLALLAALAFQTRQQVRYAGGLIRSIDVTRTASWRIAQWIQANLPGERVLIGGSFSFQFNDFTDNPQMYGGHEAMLPGDLLRRVMYQIYSGTDAEGGGGSISALWLKAFGARAVSVPGPGSAETYKPFRDPAKFEGVLPVLWREGADTIYGVPGSSLAHVLPAAAVVRTKPESGLDIAQVKTYVNALEDPSLPAASWQWTSWHEGVIHSLVRPGDAISIRITSVPGWKATINGVLQKIHSDGLGLLVVDPVCTGECTVDLSYTGGSEWLATSFASLAVMLAIAALALARIVRTRRLYDNGW